MRVFLTRILIWLLSKVNPQGGCVLWNGNDGTVWRADVYPPEHLVEENA